MKASEAKALSKQSVRDEIIIIEALIEVECNKGNRKLSLDRISDGAIAYFIDNDYEVITPMLTGDRIMSVLIKW